LIKKLRHLVRIKYICIDTCNQKYQGKWQGHIIRMNKDHVPKKELTLRLCIGCSRGHPLLCCNRKTDDRQTDRLTH
jgi:hypothetical protein